MSEWDYVSWPDRYLYSENINTTSNPHYIELWLKPAKYINTAKTIHSLLEINDRVSNSSVIASFCSDWVIHINSDTAAYTNAGLWHLEYPVFILDWYVYFVNSWWATSAFLLNRTTITDAISWTWSPTLSYATLSTNDYFEFHWALVVQFFAYIWLWNKINKFDSQTWLVEEYNITGWEEIVWITYNAGNYKIYTETWKMAIWNWVEDTVSFVWTTINFNIKKVYQKWSIDYIVSWDESWWEWLYYMNWYTAVVIYQNTYSKQLADTKFKFQRWQSISSYIDKLVMVEQWNSYLRLCTMWKDLQWYPNAYNCILATNSYWRRIELLNAVLYSKWYIYYSYSDWVNKWVDRFLATWSTWTKQTTWYIVTNINDLQLWIDLKSYKWLYFKVKDITSTQYIEVYKSDDWWSYSLVWTINSQPEHDIARLNMTWFFRDFSYKFILYSNSSTSPKIYYWFKHKYDSNDITN